MMHRMARNAPEIAPSEWINEESTKITSRVQCRHFMQADWKGLQTAAEKWYLNLGLLPCDQAPGAGFLRDFFRISKPPSCGQRSGHHQNRILNNMVGEKEKEGEGDRAERERRTGDTQRNSDLVADRVFGVCCWGPEPTATREFLRYLLCKKRWFYSSTGTGLVGGRNRCPGVVRSGWW